MDMMLLGETIVSTSTVVQKLYLGPWMPAGGNEGVAGCEVFWNSSTPCFTVHLETKSSDQDDAGAASIGSVAVNIVGATITSYKFDVAGAKDLVRYRVDNSKAGVMHVQFAQPLWHPN